jgi:hypothetical protein
MGALPTHGISDTDGYLRSLADGTVPVSGLTDTPPGTQVIVTAWDGKKSESTVIVTT